MNKGRLLIGVAVAFLFLLPAAAFATTYTYPEFNCNPQTADGSSCTVLMGGSITITLTTSVSSKVPSGTVNWYCVNGLWNTRKDGSGVNGGSCATLPLIPPGPACSSGIGFVNYQVTEITVQTPPDPIGPDVYMLGNTHNAGITAQPIVVGPSQTATVVFGPEIVPQVIGSSSYVWYRVGLNGAHAGGSIITHPTPPPTSLAGTYLVDIEGTMNCGTVSHPIVQYLHFDVGYFVVTSEYGSTLLGVGSMFLVLAAVFLKKKVVVPHIA